KEYYRSMFRGQLCDGRREVAGDLGIARALVRVTVLGQVGEHRQGILAALGVAGVERGVRELRLPALMVDAEIHGDPGGPGVEAGVTLEPVEALVCLGEGLLGDIECVISVSQHSERERGDLALVALDQLSEGLPIALPGPLDELPVARPHGTIAYQTRSH